MLVVPPLTQLHRGARDREAEFPRMTNHRMTAPRTRSNFNLPVSGDGRSETVAGHGARRYRATQHKRSHSTRTCRRARWRSSSGAVDWLAFCGRATNSQTRPQPPPEPISDLSFSGVTQTPDGLVGYMSCRDCWLPISSVSWHLRQRRSRGQPRRESS
jgi:hypothetical protein